MNKIISVIFLLLPILLKAQINESLYVLEGNLSYSSNSSLTWIDYIAENVESKTNTFRIQPKFGRFINETSLLGIGLAYQNTKMKVLDDQEANSNSFSINPYFSHYYKISENFYFTSNITLSFGFGKETDFNDNEFNSSTIGISGQPGISYFLNNHWALKTTFGKIYYSNTKTETYTGENKNKDSSDDFGINLSMDSFSFGASYFF
ncbi:outer membrane beta-barrel protein [Carboxylicivirga linearis]|uniref:Outer membrane beta-barrel protein n=1 Tax=Carboxylicivirga linearis TaxID=1628157 RepID=A0ABS5K1I9_9BACT|nr:outer membrane beta-barrel protein [Carboxylicivirga linearis]MBS2101014.1 outer membrane beta-barrel protein [Carboxylicivirga linearis]